MDEDLRGRAILILAVVAAIFFISTVSSCSAVGRLRHAKDKEMATRLDLEEKMSKFTTEKTALDSKLSSQTQALEEEKAAHEVTKKALLQEQMVNQSIKEELQKVSKLKEALEEDLKEALVANKASKTKK